MEECLMLHYYFLNMCQEGTDVQVFPLHMHVWVNCHALPQQISPSLEQLPLSRGCRLSPQMVVHPRAIHSPRRLGFTSRLQILLLVKGGVGGFRLQRGALVVLSCRQGGCEIR